MHCPVTVVNRAIHEGRSGGLARYLEKELGSRRIAVNTVAPDAIATDFGGGRVRDDAQVNKLVASVTALGRAGEPDEIGPMLGDEIRWITGSKCLAE